MKIKLILIAIILANVLQSCKTMAVKNNSSEVRLNTESKLKLVEEIVENSKKYIGTPYKFGGKTLKGMDCSGFVQTNFADLKITLPRTSLEMSKVGLDIDFLNAQKGDLIFFTTNGKLTINHVGLVIEKAPNEIKFIHSSTKKGVTISSTNEDYYMKNLAKIKRVL